MTASTRMEGPIEGIPLTSYPGNQVDDRHSLQEDDLESGELESRALLDASRTPLDDSEEQEPHQYDEDSLLNGQALAWMRGRLQDRKRPFPFRVLPTWIHGPASPRRFRIEPFFPDVQLAPARMLDRWLPSPGSRCGALLAFYILWILLFSLVLAQSASSPEFPGLDPPVQLSCISRLWSNSTDCGLNGDDCMRSDGSSFAFRCPAYCKDTKVLEPYAVGAQEVVYRSMVIGGQSDSQPRPTYRGDSFICAAALHAGVTNDNTGGCGIVTPKGEKSYFPGVDANGISSIGFPSYFPLAFEFGEPDEGKISKCRDLRWPLLGISALFTSVLSVFTTSPAVLFVSVFTGSFIHVALVSEPPDFVDYYEGVSSMLGRFLPAAFMAAVVYHFCVQRSLQNLKAPLEKTILWLGGFWVGALNNYTFDNIPISRLTPHDLRQQPGAVVALIILASIILAIALGQAWAFWREGRLPTYLKLYGTLVVLVLAFAAIPRMNLRIHHYILALLFLPGTALQTRPSLLYQGILLGLFVNGVARWGFDSILQTPAQLLGDGQLGSALPAIASPTINSDSITFAFSNWAAGIDGLSVLINDVERFRSYVSANGTPDPDSFTWERHKEGLPEFFRFGYMFRDPLGNPWYGDFTKAGTWKENGTWVHMEPGPDR